MRYALVLMWAVLMTVGGNVKGAHAAPSVVVTIKPLHGLVSMVSAGVFKPELLLEANTSPHAYALRPSERRAIDRADLIVWIGPELESFMPSIIDGLGGDQRLLEVMQLEDLYTLPVRQGGGFEAHRRQDHGQDQNRYPDPHVWLDINNASLIVAEVAAVLSDIDPANQNRYVENAFDARHKLVQLRSDIQASLGQTLTKPYFVFHDAYQYFEAGFGLNVMGSVSVNPQRLPGARRIIEIRTKIRRSGARCMFSEPQFSADIVATIVEGLDLRSGILDPLGADLRPGVNAYGDMMKTLADSIVNCQQRALQQPG